MAPKPTQLVEFLTDLKVQATAKRLAKYLASYDGGEFETYGTNDPYRIAGDDLVAVTYLSLEIRNKRRSGISTRTARALEDNRGEVAALLQAIPSQLALSDLDNDAFNRHLGLQSAASRLYVFLRSDEIGLPRVATSKLLARKRPNLLPVFDSVTGKAAGTRSSEGWWQLWWEALHENPGLVDHLCQIRSAAGANAAHLSVLRTADIAIWMTANS